VEKVEVELVLVQMEQLPQIHVQELVPVVLVLILEEMVEALLVVVLVLMRLGNLVYFLVAVVVAVKDGLQLHQQVEQELVV